MDPNINPTPHPDPWVDLLRGYVTEAVGALTARGIPVQHSWLDPRNPRDGTIVWRDLASSRLMALVWDEETGWRRGGFVTGKQGQRTILAETAHLGGGVLPEPGEVAHRLVANLAEVPRQYRSFGNLHDGLDAALSSRILLPSAG